jgi:cytoskeletal protein CcmA (bactofilin family)
VSHPPESAWAIYVDGELHGDALRRAEAHLVGCPDCRTRVVALREEARLLADVLHERAPALRAPAGADAPDPARGLALGFPIALAGALAAFTVGGLALEGRLPGGLEVLNPLRLKGAVEMAFDLAFWLRDEVPGLVEFVLAVAVVVSVSALGSFAVSHLLRRISSVAGLGLAAALLLPGARPASALDVRHEHRKAVRVAEGETVADTLVVSAHSLDVDGVVEGDLVAAVERLTIRGRVTGNVFVFAEEIELPGAVGGSLVAVAEALRVEGVLGGTVYAAAEQVTLRDSARLRGDANVASHEAILEGELARDLACFCGSLEVRGVVGRNVTARAERVQILGGARVGGDVDAFLPEGETLEIAGGASVAGEARTNPIRDRRHDYLSHWRRPGFYVFFVIQFAAGFLFGLLLHALAPRLFDADLRGAGDFFRTAGWGFLALVATPVAILLVALTLVGIPVAVLALFAFLTALYAADILVGALVGRALLRPGPRPGSFGRSLLVGYGIVLAGHAIPFLGIAVGAVSALLGLGLAVDRLRAFWSARAS